MLTKSCRYTINGRALKACVQKNRIPVVHVTVSKVSYMIERCPTDEEDDEEDVRKCFIVSKRKEIKYHVSNCCQNCTQAKKRHQFKSAICCGDVAFS